MCPNYQKILTITAHLLGMYSSHILAIHILLWYGINPAQWNFFLQRNFYKPLAKCQNISYIQFLWRKDSKLQFEGIIFISRLLKKAVLLLPILVHQILHTLISHLHLYSAKDFSRTASRLKFRAFSKDFKCNRLRYCKLTIKWWLR